VPKRCAPPALGAYDSRLPKLDLRFKDRVTALNWDDVKLLTVRSDRLRRWWRPGLLLIGDAAHAMSPIGGVGINLAVQDAVATANLLGLALAAGGAIPEQALAAIQRRLEPAVKSTQ
jgi:2-polyprenyl-6-methoxyphenol hydroxylase-like FAD-dependent oxidoreductase